MISIPRIAFIGVTTLGLGTMWLSAPSGGPLLASPPPPEKVKKAPSGSTTGSVRRGSRGPSFIWVGGGYRGGK